jgi:hypothetical protein
VAVLLVLTGDRDLGPLTAALGEVEGVLAVAPDDPATGPA